MYLVMKSSHQNWCWMGCVLGHLLNPLSVGTPAVGTTSCAYTAQQFRGSESIDVDLS